MTTMVAAVIRVEGLVQGVGFRPFVYQLATEIGLVGSVHNDAAGVTIVVQGRPDQLEELYHRVSAEAPPLALVTALTATDVPVRSDVADFRIVESRQSTGATFVAPDTAVCDDCVSELRDPTNRRFEHPFITCTNCGPRFSITRRLPYDRSATTMAGFAMCPSCAAEYEDPANRRYHAQPISCHECGPTLSWSSTNRLAGDDPITAAAALIAEGKVAAIKGIGGFHLCTNAFDEDAVQLLRERKQRPDKPFAVLVPSLEVAEQLAHLNELERETLCSAARPIVLCRSRGQLASGVAPGHPLVGIMIAYAPIHHLLFDALGPELSAVVATSGNRSGTPIAYRSETVEEEIGHLYDGLLDHDRPIHTPSDDSVVRIVSSSVMPIRRSRGYAPLPVALGSWATEAPASLAVGGELKSTFALSAGRHVWLSQHLGDMGTMETLAAFTATLEQFSACYGVAPQIVAADAHPNYHTRRWAEAQELPVTTIQHHRAHVAALLAESGRSPCGEGVIAFSFDGTGYGDDSTIWGGEVFATDRLPYQRVAHLRPLPLPGGDQAVLHPYRIALAYLHASSIDWQRAPHSSGQASDAELRFLERQIERGIGCVKTSSMGRLFDAVSSLCGLRHHITYEAQGAIELEIAAVEYASAEAHFAYSFARDVVDDVTIIDPAPVLAAVVDDINNGVSVGRVAARFHHAVADLTAAMSREADASAVALTGGVFQNALLCELIADRVPIVLTHKVVPANDGGLALGQAVLAIGHHLQLEETHVPSRARSSKGNRSRRHSQDGNGRLRRNHEGDLPGLPPRY